MIPQQPDFLVRIYCPTYNHAPYIVDAMNGITMQQTDFPFVCTIIDDASTDGEQEVIKAYLEENFDLDDNLIVRNEETDDCVLTFARHKTNLNCYFAVIYLKYNHYSIDKSRLVYISDWTNTKYVAICEGDDYWLDPHKMQVQVNFLENNTDYTMTCNRSKLYSVRQHKMIGENYCYEISRDIIPEDIINRTGLFISTCSIVYRKWVEDNKPNYWRTCKVGDYPLQIACAIKGKTYYFNEMMSVYRVQNPASWTGQQKWGQLDRNRLETIKSQINMFRGFAQEYPEYSKTLINKIYDQINRNVPNRFISYNEYLQYLDYFSKEISQYSIKAKIDLFLRTCKIPRVRGLYLRFFLEKYNQRIFYYS